MVADVIDRFGQIDILVNCQGWDRLEPFVESSEETWEKLLAINFKSVLYTARAVLPNMISRNFGKVVNISLRCRPSRFQLGSGLCGRQRRGDRFFKDHRPRSGALPNKCERRMSRANRDAVTSSRAHSVGAYRQNHRCRNQGDAVSPDGKARRDRRSRAVSDFAGGEFHHRPDAQCQRRLDDGVALTPLFPEGQGEDTEAGCDASSLHFFLNLSSPVNLPPSFAGRGLG